MVSCSKTEAEIIEFLKKHKIKPSMIRVRVLKHLCDNNDHPNADALFKDLSSEIPTLSKTSIYNAVKVFIDAGIVREVNIEDNEVRYDACLDKHAHFKCVRCGTIMNIELACPECDIKGMDGAKVLDEQIYIKGVCKECMGREKRNVG